MMARYTGAELDPGGATDCTILFPASFANVLWADWHTDVPSGNVVIDSTVVNEAVPEPALLGLLGLGFAGIAARARRRRA